MASSDLFGTSSYLLADQDRSLVDILNTSVKTHLLWQCMAIVLVSDDLLKQLHDDTLIDRQAPTKTVTCRRRPSNAWHI